MSARLLFIWLLCAVAGTLAPFNFTVPASAAQEGLRLFQYQAYQRDPIDLVLNLLLFLPLGALLHHSRDRAATLPSTLVIAGGFAVLISSSVEYLQAFLPVRDSSLIDVIANAIGAMLGVLADRFWGRSLVALVAHLRERTSPARLAGALVVYLLPALIVSGALQARTRLSNWDSNFPLIVGNELTGDRPWLGRVLSVDITDAATARGALRRFSAGESIDLPGQRLAGFDFRSKTPQRDATGLVPDFRWTTPLEPVADEGVVFDGAWLQGERPASALVERLRSTNAFTLRVTCAALDANQDGPARIVSNSSSTLLRNFTLGQQGSDLVFRLRTPATGENGYPMEVHAPGIFSSREMRDLLVTYDGATLLVAAANSGRITRAEFGPGATAAIAIPTLNVQLNELDLYELAYIAVLSLIPGVLIGLFARSSDDRHAFGASWVVSLAMLLEVTLVATSGRAFDWGNVVITAFVATAVVLLVSSTMVPPDMQVRRPARAWRLALGRAS